MKSHITVTDNATIITLSGEVVVPDCNRFLAEFEQKITHIDRAVIIDMHDVVFVDSRGLGALVFIYTRTRKADYSFAISGLKPEVMKVLKLTALDTIFTFYQTVQDALKHI